MDQSRSMMNQSRAIMRMMDEEERQMITVNNGMQIPFTFVKPRTRLPPLEDDDQILSLWSRPGTVAYPTDGQPAIIKFKDPAGGDKYLVNPMIPGSLQMQQSGLKLSPCTSKLLDDYHETLLKHPEIAAYISATGGGNSMPPPPPFERLRLLQNLNLSASSDIAASG